MPKSSTIKKRLPPAPPNSSDPLEGRKPLGDQAMNVLLSFRVSTALNSELDDNYNDRKLHDEDCPEGYNFADHCRYLLRIGMNSARKKWLP